MQPYFQNEGVAIYQKDCRDMSELPDESVDLVVTDPPYQLSSTSRPRPDQSASGSYGREVPFSRQQSRIRGFMGKEWDVLPPVEVWRECLRVLKPGAFAFVMTTPRQDSLCQILMDLTNAGFQMSFSSLYWAYAQGFPKAANMAKMVDKRLGAEREVIGETQWIDGAKRKALPKKATVDYAGGWQGTGYGLPITLPATPQAKALEHSFAGFQPKPAIEIILVAMRPLFEKTYVDQALKNRKGITWLGDCRIPYESEEDRGKTKVGFSSSMPVRDGWHGHDESFKPESNMNQSGRFPADLLVSDDVLNDGRVTKSGKDAVRRQEGMFVEHKLGGLGNPQVYHPDSGSFSRYFDLDRWWEERIKELPASVQKTFPFLIVSKASKGEKNKGIGDAALRTKHGSTPRKNEAENKSPNPHPTVKPVKLLSFLITLGSREGDTVLDNFGGSGTTAVAAPLLGRKCVMYETEEKYCEIAANRCRQATMKI